MKTFNLSTMTKGWFVGNFEPTALKTDVAEVAYRRFQAGAVEDAHVHKIAREVTVIIEGRVLMNGVEYGQGSIIVLEPGESADFKALTDGATLVVKTPSVPGDKYPV